MELQEGQPAPEFRLQANDGKTYDLNDLRGKQVLLYFYPKADTPGCTTEACQLRDNIRAFEDRGMVVLGISPDEVQEQKKFSDKYDLPFPLLADVGADIAQKYGVWVEKERMGRKYMGINRTTFLIDQNGNIERIWRNVKPDGHAAEVLAEAGV